MGSPLPGHTWSPSNLKCLHSFHLDTFRDLVQWDRVRTYWSWREINGPRRSRAHYTLSPSQRTQRFPSSRAKLGTSPPATFSRGQPPSLRFFPPAVFPPRGGTPSRSFTTAGSSHTRPTLPLKARSFVLPPVLSCTMALWPPTTGFQRSSVPGDARAFLFTLVSSSGRPTEGGGNSWRFFLPHCASPSR